MFSHNSGKQQREYAAKRGPEESWRAQNKVLFSWRESRRTRLGHQRDNERAHKPEHIALLLDPLPQWIRTEPIRNEALGREPQRQRERKSYIDNQGSLLYPQFVVISCV